MRRRPGFIFPLVIPVMPKLVTEMYGKDISSGSLMFGWIIAAYALMQFIFSPVLGNLSDLPRVLTALRLSGSES